MQTIISGFERTSTHARYNFKLHVPLVLLAPLPHLCWLLQACIFICLLLILDGLPDLVWLQGRQTGLCTCWIAVTDWMQSTAQSAASSCCCITKSATYSKGTHRPKACRNWFQQRKYQYSELSTVLCLGPKQLAPLTDYGCLFNACFCFVTIAVAQELLLWCALYWRLRHVR